MNAPPPWLGTTSEYAVYPHYTWICYLQIGIATRGCLVSNLAFLMPSFSLLTRSLGHGSLKMPGKVTNQPSALTFPLEELCSIQEANRDHLCPEIIWTQFWECSTDLDCRLDIHQLRDSNFPEHDPAGKPSTTPMLLHSLQKRIDNQSRMKPPVQAVVVTRRRAERDIQAKGAKCGVGVALCDHLCRTETTLDLTENPDSPPQDPSGRRNRFSRSLSRC